MAKRRRKPKRTANRGELPGEYLKRSLVAVKGTELGAGGRILDDHWIVKTTRLDGEWRFQVEHRGEAYLLPHKVVQQIVRHMEAIVRQQRRDRAVERAQTIVRDVESAQP